MQSLEEKIAQLTGDVYSTFLAKGRQIDLRSKKCTRCSSCCDS